MNFSDALKSIIKPHEEDQLTPLSTIWGESLDPSSVLSDYPRPQMRRDSFISLNGFWDYAFTDSPDFPRKYDGQILVPFSPESALSGVNRQLTPDEFLWYRTILPLPDLKETNGSFSGLRLLLHFGAVDYKAEVYVNGQSALTHLGGYLPFHADITELLKEEANELIIKVQDATEAESQARGKQTLRRGGIFYTAQSGIWQSVWMEWTPASYVESLWFETDFDARKVTAHIAAFTHGEIPSLTLSVSCKGREILRQSLAPQASDPQQDLIPQTSDLPENPALQTSDLPETPTLQASDLPENPAPQPSDLPENPAPQPSDLPIPAASYPEAQSGCTRTKPQKLTAALSFSITEEDFHAWSPEDPFLYDVKLLFGTDVIQSYFALRLYSIEKPAGQPGDIPVFCLNHKPYFLMGVLDQGYWPDGLYTAPSDDALLYDITTMKSLGFNMLRKHIKIENARWYYHCDRLGMIVCQDMVNGGSRYHMPVISYLPTLCPSLAAHFKDSHYAMLSRKDLNARKQWEKECLETVEYLKFFPSIAIWAPFNEGWGQFDTARITGLIKNADPSRLIDSASGWFDQNCGDFISVHNYFRPLSVSVKKWGARAFFLSEYGGYACHIKEHSSVERVFGYKRYDTLSELKKAYRELIEKSLLPLQAQGLSGAVYTQLSDVEEEVNGILTYDRKINKLSD